MMCNHQIDTFRCQETQRRTLVSHSTYCSIPNGTFGLKCEKSKVCTPQPLLSYTLVSRKFYKILNSIDAFQANLKTCLDLPVPPHHCLRLVFGLYYLVGHAYSFCYPYYEPLLWFMISS